MEGNREKVYIYINLFEAHNGIIHSFRILFDFSKFSSVFKLISQVSCQDLPTNRKKQTGHCHPDYKGKRCEIRE